LIHYLNQQGKPKLGNLEAVLNFEKFDKPKTIENVSEWLDDSFKANTIKEPDIDHMSADGGSNAIGSIAEYESLTRTSRGNNVFFNICFAHQVNRSGGYASGSIKFAEPVNEPLGKLLNKNHTIQVRFCRSGTHMKVLHDVQTDNGRCPLLLPNPAGETRWGGCIEETENFNRMAGDLTEANAKLLGPDGPDRGMLTEEEAVKEDLSRLTVTDREKMVLCQFEGASGPTMTFLKFTQDNRNAFSYMLFHSKLAVAMSRNDSFTIHPGKCMHKNLKHTISI
jgi:hypothetical protein